MIDFVLEQLELLPFLFAVYLALEWLEVHAGGALEKCLERARSIGPAAAALAGVFPQCGFSAVAASLYSGGIITIGTLLAVFLSTSDELIPVMIGAKAPAGLIVKIVAVKTVSALVAGFLVNAFVVLFRGSNVPVAKVDELCVHSRCSCREHKGIVVPALIHTAEIFAFVFAVSALVELALHFFGAGALESLALNRPVSGAFVGALIGLVPNCAVSAAAAGLYVEHPELISSGALMASSFTGCGVGMLVLFRTNRNLRQNLAVLALVAVAGMLLGMAAGCLI
ncbi:MAG: arsenic efflux protein [Kiritimatiellae bacterium]|nr:arsenic efflux protein [Kiritimatiellia bacterium]